MDREREMEGGEKVGGGGDLGDEDAGLRDPKGVAGVVAAPHDAQPQRAACLQQSQLL